MWKGFNKAITFGFDDGVTQDIRLVEIFNKYGLKSTFFLNSGLFGQSWDLRCGNNTVLHKKILPSEVRDLYAGHEVASHTLTHPDITTLSDEELIKQVQEDVDNLSKICGYEVTGMAYPGGKYDQRTLRLIKEKTTIQYARSTQFTKNYNNVQRDNLCEYHPTIYYIDSDFESLVESFLASKSLTPQLLYIFGHSYEMDSNLISWEKFEGICKKLSGQSDIFYGTNREVLMGD